MKQRIEYLDAMRGMTILLVVYGHIALNCGASVDAPFCWMPISTFYMPLFFFLSGLLSYAVLPPYFIK